MALNSKLARTTGLLYMALFVFGMAGPLVLESLIVPGDPASTAARLDDAMPLFQASLGAWLIIVVLDIVLSVTLYQLLRPARPTGALVVGATRLLYTAMLAANLTHLADAHAVANSPALATAEGQAMVLESLESFSRAFAVALAIFGSHLAALGIAGSGPVPKPLAATLVAAGLAYPLDTAGKLLGMASLEALSDVFMGLAVVGEMALMIWLLFAGRRATRRTRLASDRASDRAGAALRAEGARRVAPRQEAVQ